MGNGEAAAERKQGQGAKKGAIAWDNPGRTAQLWTACNTLDEREQSPAKARLLAGEWALPRNGC